MGKSEVIMPLMIFGKVDNNGQYDVEVNLNGTGINITKVILDKINQGAKKRIVDFDEGKRLLKYTSETLLPPPNKIDNEKTKLLFILGNPATHSIENKMFFFSKNDRVSRHGFWGKLAKNCLLQNFELETREEEAEKRRTLILTGNTNNKFVVGFTTFYSFPTPVEGDYKDAAGVKKLFRKKLLERIETEEFARMITGVENQPEVSSVAKGAILIPTIIRARDYLCNKINDDRVKPWPIRGKESGWKDLQQILARI